MQAHVINSESVSSFLHSYVAAFNACNGVAIAMHYACPSLSLRGDGACTLLESRELAAPHFTTMAKAYADQGCVDWRAENVDIHPVGSKCALVSVDWTMLRSDGSAIRTWRHSYNLLANGTHLLILLAAYNSPSVPA